MRYHLTESYLTDLIANTMNSVLNEVRYIDVANRFGGNGRPEKSSKMGWDDPQEIKRKFMSSIQMCNWTVKDMSDKRNNPDVLTFYIEPNTPEGKQNFNMEGYLKSVYGLRYGMSMKEHGNGYYVSLQLNTDSNYEPIGKHEKIRVFHGTDIQTAIKIAKNGLSGKERAKRTYSYEYGMNPNGLFVTTDFEKAKDFGYHYCDQVILEFTVDSNDLDTPVWNGQGTYFGQSTNPQAFLNRSERITQKLQYQRDAEASEFPFVSQSDNPAMAEKIFNNDEHQALFYGDLMPNQIKRFWWKQKGTQEYIPMSYKQFMAKFGNTTFQRTEYGRTSDVKIEREKLYWPNESWMGPEDFAERMKKYYTQKGWGWDESDTQYAIDLAKTWEGIGFGEAELDMSNQEQMERVLYPKQIVDILGVDKYRDNFDRFYPEFRMPGQRV